MLNRRMIGPARILILESGDSPLWIEMSKILGAQGYKTEIGKNASLDGFNTIIEIRDALAHVDFVVFTVSAADLELNGKDTLRQRFAHKIGLTRGALEMNGVVLLTEKSVYPIFSNVNIQELSYDPFSLVGAANGLVGTIQDVLGPKIDARYLQRRIRKQIQEPETLVGFLMLCLVLLVGLNSLIRVLGAMNGESEPVSIAAVEPEGPLRENSNVFAVERSQNQRVRLASGNHTFPATCRITTTKNELLPEKFACENIGEISVSGVIGPWHNNIRYLLLDPGVSVEVRYESGRSDTFISGVNAENLFELNASESSFGVAELVFSFSAVNQKVIFHYSDNAQVQMVYNL